MKLVYGDHVDIHNADVFTMKNEHSYAAFIGVLSTIFMKAHATASLRTEPYTSALIISPSMTAPYKNQPESSLVRIQSIINRMQEPTGGIRLSIYVAEVSAFAQEAKVGLKHSVSQCWPITSRTGTKLTVNFPPNQLNKGDNKVRYFTQQQLNVVFDHAIDYMTPIESVFSILDDSRAHVSYQGGTAWLSVAMNKPTYIIHPTGTFESLHHKSKLFGQDLGNINILSNNKITHVRSHPAEHHIHIKDIKSHI